MIYSGGHFGIDIALHFRKENAEPIKKEGAI